MDDLSGVWSCCDSALLPVRVPHGHQQTSAKEGEYCFVLQLTMPSVNEPAKGWFFSRLVEEVSEVPPPLCFCLGPGLDRSRSLPTSMYVCTVTAAGKFFRWSIYCSAMFVCLMARSGMLARAFSWPCVYRASVGLHDGYSSNGWQVTARVSRIRTDR